MYCTCRFYVIRWCCRSQCCTSLKNTVDCQGGMAPSPYAQGPQSHSPTAPQDQVVLGSFSQAEQNVEMRNRQKCWWRSLYVRHFFVLKVAPNDGKRMVNYQKRYLAISWNTITVVHLCLLENSWAKNLGKLWKSTPCPIDCEIVPFFQGLATPKAIP